MKFLITGKCYTEGFALHIAEAVTAMGHGVRGFEPGLHVGRIGGRLENEALRKDMGQYGCKAYLETFNDEHHLAPILARMP